MYEVPEGVPKNYFKFVRSVLKMRNLLRTAVDTGYTTNYKSIDELAERVCEFVDNAEAEHFPEAEQDQPPPPKR